MNKRIIILGSGKSILDLSEEEINEINSSDYIIAMNKYMAFYDVVNICPNSVYFHDLYGLDVFRHIVKKVLNDKLNNMNFFLHPYLAMFLYKGKKELSQSLLKDLFYRCLAICKIVIKLNYKCSLHRAIAFRAFEYYKIPESYNVQVVNIGDYMAGGRWARSFNENLFHFRGSLTTCINVASILSPGADIYLVGNDFYGSEYFYQEQLEKSNIHWKDYTYKETKSKGVHFSFIKVNGTKMTDKFPFILSELEKVGCNIYCINKDSLLVKENCVDYKSILEK